jgi:antitoxin ParD1/3/4
MPVENREAEDAAKLQALRAAAHVGEAALERGELREFADASALVAHLNAIADAAISAAADK